MEARRRAHNRPGFAAQLTTVRFLGQFMSDPWQVPLVVTGYLVKQLGIADTSVAPTGAAGTAGSVRNSPRGCQAAGKLTAQRPTRGEGRAPRGNYARRHDRRLHQGRRSPRSRRRRHCPGRWREHRR
nr:DUF4158 domain-containing protein [Kitasatospora viridis]